MMKRKLMSVMVIAALIMTTAVCSYAANGSANSKSDKNTTTTEQGITVKNDKTDADSAVKKEAINQKKEQIRAEYTEAEQEAVDAAADKIKKEDPKAKVLGFDSVISDNAKFKFDTPPVIKDGRTLVPVRAITQGFGAELTFNAETKVITITKGETVIALTLGSTVAIVNGQEVQMDTKANIVNSRTYVPLRFVLETFKLSVEWDSDTETIEINDDTTEATTDSAITIVKEDTTTSSGAVTVTE